MSDYEKRSYNLSIKKYSDDGHIEGYASVFGVRDDYDDIIMPGAFANTLSVNEKSGSRPCMLWQHHSDLPIGVWTDMREDEHGLFVRGKLVLKTTQGHDAYELLKEGAINGISIGFYARKWTLSHDDNNILIRTLTEIDLREISLVTFPANDYARITQIKSRRPEKSESALIAAQRLLHTIKNAT